MSKNKKNIAIIICLLVLLLTAIGFIIYGSVKESKGPTYMVTIEESVHGVVKSDKLIYKEGDLVTLTIIPKGAFELDKILIDGIDKTTDVKDDKLQV